MIGMSSPLTRRLLGVYLGTILVLMYVPIVPVALASISQSRFFVFPIRNTSSKWYQQTFDSLQVHSSFITSLSVAGCVALVSVVVAFFGALACAR
jgi:spermidine/putrescine transport system permease protein